MKPGSRTTALADAADSHEFLTPAEAQRLLRVGRSAIYSSLRDGTLPSIRVGRLIRVLRAALIPKSEDTSNE